MGDYYNEHDPFAAQWLRNLIAAGHLPPGDVDERSIEDVVPSDLVGYRHCHFFAGIGGWAYAMQLAGWPDDVPLWTGSCPCQPFSAAGKSGGFTDERHLWPAWCWLITQCQPRHIAGEQVASADALRWWDLVATDLEGQGYTCTAVDLPAASVGAPHKRSRLFWVAHAVPTGRAEGWPIAGIGSSAIRGTSGLMADAECGAAERLGHAVAGTSGRIEGAGHQRQWVRDDTGHGGHAVVMADAEHQQQHGRWRTRRRRGESTNDRVDRGLMADAERSQRGQKCVTRQNGCDRAHDRRRETHGEPRTRSEVRDVADACGERRDGQPVCLCERGSQQAGAEVAGSGGVGDMGHADHARLEGRQLSAQCARERAAGASGLAGHWADGVWLPCTDGKARPTQPGLFPLATGVPNRVGTLRGAGNAIVPQVAAEVLSAWWNVTR